MCFGRVNVIASTEIYNDVRTNMRPLRHHISERIDLGDTG